MSVSAGFPILVNHDPENCIGFLGSHGILLFEKSQRITQAMLLEIFGNAGIRVIEAFSENGVIYIRQCEILEFSLGTSGARQGEAMDLQQASRQIGAILKKLEEDTGQRVSSIEIKETDATTVSSPGREIISSVEIQLEDPSHRTWI